MSLKFKKPFGPGVGAGTKVRMQELQLRRDLEKKGMKLRRLPSGVFDIIRIPKGPTVKTPRKTSRGISF